MHLYLVRHGQTDLNLHHRVQGQVDTHGLNATGQRQVSSLAAFLALSRLPADALLSSPLKRARETADAVNTVFNLPITVDDRLKEMFCGIAESHPVAEVENWTFDPSLTYSHASSGQPLTFTTGKQLRQHLFSADPGDDLVSYPGGETAAQTRTRALAAIEDFLAAHPTTQHLWVVAHSLLIKSLMMPIAPAIAGAKLECATILHLQLTGKSWKFIEKISPLTT